MAQNIYPLIADILPKALRPKRSDSNGRERYLQRWGESVSRLIMRKGRVLRCGYELCCTCAYSVRPTPNPYSTFQVGLEALKLLMRFRV